MDITDEQREERFAQSSPTAKKLYEDGVGLLAVFSKHHIPQARYRDYALLVGDVVLGLINRSDLVTLFAQRLGLSEISSLRLTADVLEFLAPLHQTQPLHQEIAETEAALAQTIPVRTMARDMHDLESQAPAEAPVYRSEQPSVRNRPLTDIPRWDSERT
jgi:hypothetical protein